VADYLVTHAAILGDKVIVGSAIGDNRRCSKNSASYGLRCPQWPPGLELDPIPREASNPVYKEWDPASIATASAQRWAPLSVDARRRLVLCHGSASPDFFGGLRPGDNRWPTPSWPWRRHGLAAMGQQLVHHDLWDYDLASQRVW